MPATREKIDKFLSNPNITDREKLVIEWQFGLCGSFYSALWDAIKRADETNLRRLSQGFPDHVAGYQAWAFGDPYSMGEKLRAFGLGI